MMLLLSTGLASSLAVLVSLSGLNPTLGRHNPDENERWWPSDPAAALASLQHDGRGRGLQSGKKGTCVRSLLQLVEPAELNVINGWHMCVFQKQGAARTVAGGLFGVNLDCWCAGKVEEVLKEFGCCDHDDFHLLCEAQCPNERNCTSVEAQTCIQNCPALCLEANYHNEFCSKGCTSECFKHMGCIAEHSKEMTLAGRPDHNYICDPLLFYNSKQWMDWQTCYFQHPMRTHWHRHNAENNCYCEADLKAAAEQSNCCDTKWGKTICDAQCSIAESSIDCESAEATSCAKECAQTCSMLYAEKMVPLCKITCFDAGSRCAKYSVCKPSGAWEFDYVCDDGSKPMDNGCCMNPMTGVTSNELACPTLCDSGPQHLPEHSVAGIELRHGWECQCTGCPNTTGATQDKWKDTLTNDLSEHGVAQLALISKKLGIVGPNRRMEELMDDRNKAILAAYEAHPGAPDASFESKVSIIVNDYHVKIEAEAQRYKAALAWRLSEGEMSAALAASTGPPSTSDGSDDEAPSSGLPQGRSGKGSDELEKGRSAGSNTGLVIGALVGVVGLFLMFGILVMVYKLRRQKGGAHPNPSQGAAPYDGDSHVVMGRPVEAETDTEARTGAVPGAPVQVQSGKGSDENTKDASAKV